MADPHPEKVAELMKLAAWAQQDIGDHNRFGVNARTFGTPRRTLSSEVKIAPKQKKPNGPNENEE